MAASPKKPKKKAVDRPSTDIDAKILKTLEDLLSGGLDGMLGSSPEELIDEFLELERTENQDIGDVLDELVDVLSDLRVEANSGNREARQAVDELRAWLADRVEDEEVKGPQLMMLGRAFSEAGLEPGSGFQAVATRRMEGEAFEDSQSGVSIEAMLDDLADQAGEDPLALYESISHFSRYMPEEGKLAAAVALAGSMRDVLREAALGFLLTGDDKAMAVVCDSLGASIKRSPPSARLLDRLKRLHGLIPPARQGRLDALIQTLQPILPSSEPVPAPKLPVLLGSTPDGAGASTIMAHLGKGRYSLLVSMMFKFGQGLVDVGILDGMSRQRLNALLAGSGIHPYPVSMDFVTHRLAVALAENHAGNTPVPFMLLQVMERLGLASLQPASFQPEAIFDRVIGHSCVEAASPQDLQAAFAASDEAGLLESWFESSEEIDALLRQTRPRKQRIDLLLNKYLPTRRQFWIEQCAWSAAVLSEKTAKKSQLALWIALLGKQLCGGGSLAESPLMRFVAEGTVKAYTLQ